MMEIPRKLKKKIDDALIQDLKLGFEMNKRSSLLIQG